MKSISLTPTRLLVAITLTAIALSGGLFASKVFGQENDQSGFNLSVTPVVSNLQTKPGTSVSTKIQVKNNNVAAEKVKVSLLRLESNNQDGTPVLREPDASDEFIKWATFSETSFTLESNVWKTIDFTINPPESAAFGYYYAVVFTREDPQNQSQVTNLNGAVAIPVLLDVSAPGEVRKAELTRFSTDKNVYEFLPATFTAELKNSGNTHVAPRGNIFITKGDKNVGTLNVNEAKGNILPNSNRQFTAEWVDGSPVYKLKEVDGKVVLENGQQSRFLDWSNFDPSKIRFGKYQAKIALIYNDGVSDVATESVLDFWVIPWRIIGVFALAVLFIGGGLWVLVVRPLRKGLKKLPAIRTNKKQ